ncbi:MAG: hypothetical protein AB8B42_02470, partial [Prochlorococcus sp.]
RASVHLAYSGCSSYDHLKDSIDTFANDGISLIKNKAMDGDETALRINLTNSYITINIPSCCMF